jgi:hypothetical protein
MRTLNTALFSRILWICVLLELRYLLICMSMPLLMTKQELAIHIAQAGPMPEPLLQVTSSLIIHLIDVACQPLAKIPGLLYLSFYFSILLIITHYVLRHPGANRRGRT